MALIGRLIRILAVVVFVAAASAGGSSPAVAIVGGSAVQIQSAPWTVFVRASFSSYDYVCTGSVIDASHVVTAAHCLYGEESSPIQPALLSVEAGVSNAFSPTATDVEQFRPVSSFRVHPGFVPQPTISVDDVAVLELATPLDLSGAAVKAVALPDPGAPFPAQAAVTIAGYGLEDPSAPTPSGALEAMTGHVFYQGECQSSQHTIIQLDNGVALCNSSPTSSWCSGDSGAGLVETSGAPTLVGIVTGGPAKCPVGSDGIAVYVGAPEILSFIQGNQQPPTAPRLSTATASVLSWTNPLAPGGVLTCTTSGWSGPVQLAYSFIQVGTATLLQTGPKPTYQLPAAAAKTTIFCEVAATNDGGTTVSFTTVTPTIGPAPRITLERPRPVTGRPGQKLTLRVFAHVPAGLYAKISVCAAPPASLGTGTCAAPRDLSKASGRLAFTLSLRIKPNARPGLAHVTINATTGIASAQTTIPLRIARP